MKIKLLSAALFLTSLFFAFSSTANATDSMKMDRMEMAMTASIKVMYQGKPLANGDVYMAGQSRTTDENGRADFENVALGKNMVRVVKDGKMQELDVNIGNSLNEITLGNSWKDYVIPGTAKVNDQAQASNLLYSMIVVLLCFGTAMVLIKKRDLLVKKPHSKSRKGRRAIIGTFLALGIVSASTLGYQLVTIGSGGTQAFVGQTMAAEINTIPVPQNLKVYPDDRVATVIWDEPNVKGKIVGYVVQWGKDGVMTDSKQTTYPEVQIQPLANGVTYTVQVRSVTGKMVSPKVVDGVSYPGTYAEADQNYSPAVATTVVASSARVDEQKKRLTGFYDDFNLAAGNFDERKWNNAFSACSDWGNLNGAFINSQFHAHNQVKARSNYVAPFYGEPGAPPDYCDRAASASRPRTFWDVSVGKDGVNAPSDTNPALFEMDLDGVIRNRDKWYVDFIPATARKNGMPIDFEGHNTFFGNDSNWPGNIFRITQSKASGENYGIDFAQWGATGEQGQPVPIATTCGAWQYGANKEPVVDLSFCGLDGPTNPEFNLPLATPDHSSHGLKPIPNVRRHWVVAYTPTKISLYIDGVFIMSVKTPAFIASEKKLEVFSELFGYTTGKDYEFDSPVQPNTSIFHWDNTGFSGKPATTVVHNYLSGGASGSTPEFAMGTSKGSIPAGNRTVVIPVPDQIGNPVQARLMFTFGPIGSDTYKWSAGQNVMLVKNGVSTKLGGVDYPNPANNLVTGLQTPIADSYTNFSDGIILTAQDISNLQTGLNTFQFNLGGSVINVHLELEYTKGTEPMFTQPQDVFKTVNFNSYIMPKMIWSDSYLFVEQTLGLVLGTSLPAPTLAISPTAQPTATRAPTVVPSSTPLPTAGPSSTPTPSVTRAPTAVPSATPIPTSVVPTPTVVTTTGGTLGYKSIGSNIDSNDSNYINSSRFTMGSANKTVKTMSVYVGNVDSSPNNKFEMGIYSDKNGKPYQLVAKTSTGTLVANSWNTLPLSGTLLAGKPYWFAFNTNGTNGAVNNMRFSSGGKDGYTSSPTSFGNWPQLFGGATIGTAKFSIYVTFQ